MRAQSAIGFGEAPTGEDAGERRHVSLGIAALRSERMQFENFAREIFVEALPGEASGRGVGSDRALIVEIIDHRRMALDSFQHIREFAQHVRADGLAFERSRCGANKLILGDGNGRNDFDQNAASRSTKPAEAAACFWKRAIASARNSFCSTGGSGGFGLASGALVAGAGARGGVAAMAEVISAACPALAIASAAARSRAARIFC